MPDAQNAYRVLRYALTCMRTCGQAVAQRGVDRPPSDSERSEVGEASPLQNETARSRDDRKPFPNLNEEPELDDLCPESDVTKQFWKTCMMELSSGGMNPDINNKKSNLLL